MHVLTDMETIHQSCHIARVGKIEAYQIDLQVDDPPHPPQHSPISEVRADSLAMAIVQAVKLINKRHADLNPRGKIAIRWPNGDLVCEPAPVSEFWVDHD
jgi:hypothetical protein